MGEIDNNLRHRELRCSSRRSKCRDHYLGHRDLVAVKGFELARITIDGHEVWSYALARCLDTTG